MNSSSISPVPDGQRLFPYLVVKGAAQAIDFYTRAFGARES
jgi:PhnB protein